VKIEDKDAEALPGTAAEADFLEQAFAPAVTVLRDSEATRKALDTLRDRHYRVISFAGHSVPA
jgi:CHAT domain-containing protein